MRFGASKYSREEFKKPMQWLFNSFASLQVASLYLIAITLLFPLPSIADEGEVVIGILAKRGVEHTLQKWQPTADYLSREIPNYRFVLKPLDFDVISSTVANDEIDFILANSSFYVGLEAQYGVNRIATLRNRVGDTITSQFGGVIFSRADRDDLSGLHDLIGRSLMAVKESSLGGFHMALGELKRFDIDPNNDLRSLTFGGTHDAVVYAVLNGEVDAGTVRSDTLERMAQEGKIDMADIKLIDQHQDDGLNDFPFIHSTPLYPEWPFASLATTPYELAETVAIALLRMPATSEAAIASKSAGWGVPLNYQPVHELLKDLRLGIYQDFGKITPWDVLRLYWYWFLLGVVSLITMSFVTTHVSRLNSRLKLSHQQLHEARNNLEVRVIQRTHELEQTNTELHDVIEEHQLTLDSLRRASRDRRLLLDSAGEGIYGVDSNGKVIFANAFTVNRLGWSEEELIGNGIHAMTHHTRINGEPYPSEECPVHSTLLQRTAHSISNELFWCKDGSSFPVEYTSTPIIEDGEQKGAVVVFRDVTQRRQTEEALRHTQKMDALGKLTGGIAHDFNNMLGVILGYSELLEHKVVDNPQLEKYVKQIHRAGERAKTLTSKLLAFSRKETASAESADINQLLFDSSHMLEKTLTARIEMNLELAEELWPVWIDKASLEDAILNMCINAMHAIPENGSLILSTSNIHLEHGDLHQLDIEPGDYILLTVADSGTGMDHETLHHIFDPFFTTKGEQGTGLGMSQVYGFVQQSRGDIKIESAPGQGTRIEIYLPRYFQTDASASVQQLHPLNATPSGSETVLVVDDEAALRELTEETLTEYGYRVFTAESGERALEILKSETVDLLLSDVIMPGMDGYQLAEQVEREYPQIKIQMASGFGGKRHVGKNENLHLRRLQKPFTSDQLLQRVRELLDDHGSVLETELLQPVEWSAEIATGIEQVDEDHQILVDIMNRCIAAVEHQAEDREIGVIIEELLDYINYHFRREEVIMAACNFPKLELHRQGHRMMTEELPRRIAEFTHGQLSAMSLLAFLRSWFNGHVINKEQDGEMGVYCQGKKEVIERALAEAELRNPLAPQ